MSIVTCDITTSVDGYAAGPNQSRESPLGEGVDRLHTWMFEPTPADERIIAEWQQGNGAYVMGRNMFGPGRGEWDFEWTGWWGPEPPYAVPVFVLTNHEREPLVVGATTFNFVTAGIETALEEAQAAAGELVVAIAGGASTVNQYLAAGLIDQLHLHIAPFVLGGPGERLFEGVSTTSLEPVQVVGTPGATHIKYAVQKGWAG